MVWFLEVSCDHKNFINMKIKLPFLLHFALLIFNLANPLLAHSEEIDIKATQAIKKKLNVIVIPKVQFFETALPEVFNELQRQAKNFDQDASITELNILTFRNEDEPFPKVTISLNPMPLGKMIQFITEMVGWTYDIEANVVIVSKFGR
jgi:hypothetical protein